MHPLVTDLASLKDQEIHSKISELTKKYFMTYNPGLQMQIASVLDDLRAELATRNAKQWQEQSQNGDKSLDKLININ